MFFCEKCGAILVPKKDKGASKLVCNSCGYISNKRQSLILKEKVEVPKEKEIEVIKERIETLPKTKEICPRCKHDEAYFWLVQTRAGDEAETRFFKCVKCSHTWRSYT